MNLIVCGSEVREILVVCCDHASQIDAYLAHSKWNSEAAKGRNLIITTVHGIDSWGLCIAYTFVRFIEIAFLSYNINSKL